MHDSYNTSVNILSAPCTQTGLGLALAFIKTLKNVAFQLGQMIGLLDGVELYTKKAIGDHVSAALSDRYSPLKSILMREDKFDDLLILEEWKTKLIDRLSNFEFVRLQE